MGDLYELRLIKVGQFIEKSTFDNRVHCSLKLLTPVNNAWKENIQTVLEDVCYELNKWIKLDHRKVHGDPL
jgi:hypothetical protein